MAVTITVAQLQSALRMGSTTEETAQATRLLTYATEVISRHMGASFGDTPETVVNEAAIRVAGYLYDLPTVTGSGLANSLRNSGAAAMLLPYRQHRAGALEGATPDGMGGTSTNPVTNVTVDGSTLTVHYADGTTADRKLPTGGTGGPAVDQTARDEAAAAKMAAEAAAAAATAAGRVADTKRTAEQVNEAIDDAIENGVQEWARAAPGNEDAEGNQVYPGADTLAPDAVGGDTIIAGRNGSMSWGKIGEGSLDDDLEDKVNSVLHVSPTDTFHGSPNSINLRNVPDTVTGRRYGFFTEMANTGPVEVTIGSATKTLTHNDGSALSGGDLKVGEFIEIIDAGTRFRIIGSGSGSGTGRSDAALEKFIEGIVQPWSVRGSGDGIPGERTFVGLFEGAMEVAIPAANVTIQFAAGDNSKPDESLEETTPAQTSFAITKQQAEAADAQLRVQWDLVRNTAEGQLPTDIELLLRDSNDNVIAKHEIKDEGEGFATFPATKEGTFRWAVKVVTKGRYVGSLAITDTIYQSGDALADPSIRAVVHPIVSEEAEERQAQDEAIRQRVEEVAGLTAIIDALPEPDAIVTKTATFTAQAPHNSAAIYSIPATGFIQISIPQFGASPIIPVETIRVADSIPRTAWRYQDGSGSVWIRADNQGGGHNLSVESRATSGGGRYPGDWSTAFFAVTIRYWKPARASDGHTVSELASLETRVEKLEAKPSGGGETLTMIGTSDTVDSRGRIFQFTAATAEAFVTAWNGGTYHTFLVVVESGSVAAGFVFKSLRIPRIPAAALAATTYTFEAATGHAGSDVESIVNLLVNAGSSKSLRLSGEASTFRAGAVATVYGVS